MAVDNTTKTVTAAKAVIKINGVTSGFMSGVNARETLGRGVVRGIGQISKQEVPITTLDGTLSCNFFFISLARPEMRNFVRRDEGLDVLTNTLILGETPIEIHMYEKIVVSKSADGSVTGIEPEGKVIAIIRDFYPDSQGFSINEGQVATADVSGQFLTPMFTNS